MSVQVRHKESMTARLAWQLRERGLLVDGAKAYESPRLAEIAARQAEIMKEMNALDDELAAMAGVNNPQEVPDGLDA